jgi:Fcf2 pre-rRNA processing
MRDPDVELALAAAALHSVPAPPIPPPELTSSGKPLTKRQKKEVRQFFQNVLHVFGVKRFLLQLKNITSGPDWFDLPAPSEADLPRLYREVEALRLRNQLDSKRFYKKDEGEGKGIKGLPKFFAVGRLFRKKIQPLKFQHFKIGTVLPSTTPFGTASSDNLTRANRKRTLVDELVDDAEAKRYAKKKFEDLQSIRGARGRNTLHAKQAMRRGKW